MKKGKGRGKGNVTILAVSIVVLIIAIFSGCAMKNAITVTHVQMEDPKIKEVNIPTDPYQTLGILETDSIKKGTATAVGGVFNDILFGEYFPGRISYPCWAMDEEKMIEYFCQSTLYNLGFNGKFIVVAAIEGKGKIKVIILSTTLEFGYDLYAKEFPIERGKFAGDFEYRRKLILEKGTSIQKLSVAKVFLESVKKWNRYETPEGILLSPLGVKEVQAIAGINPQYKFIDKMIGTGRFSLVPDAVGTIAGIAVDAIRANGAPSTGWDFGSIITRRQMGLIINEVSRLKDPLIERINNVNSKLFSEYGGE